MTENKHSKLLDAHAGDNSYRTVNKQWKNVGLNITYTAQKRTCEHLLTWYLSAPFCTDVIIAKCDAKDISLFDTLQGIPLFSPYLYFLEGFEKRLKILIVIATTKYGDRPA